MVKHHQKDNSNLWVAGITVALMAIIVAGLAWSQKNDATNNIGPTAVSSSLLATPEVFYDFGFISMAKGKVTKIFTAKNNTAEAILIKKLYTSCMCTQVTLVLSGQEFGPFSMPAHGAIPEINQPVESGQEIQIRVVFDPAAHGPAGVGPTERRVIAETSDGQAIFKFIANVTP